MSLSKENKTFNDNICCFFGHRDIKCNILSVLEREIQKLINEHGVNTFYVGGYGDFDKYAAVAVNSIKKKYKDIKLFLITAYLSTLENDKEYIKRVYDEIIYPSGLETTLQKFAIIKRNEWMVEQSKYIIVYINHSWGGANKSVKYAERKERKIINIALLENVK